MPHETRVSDEEYRQRLEVVRDLIDEKKSQAEIVRVLQDTHNKQWGGLSDRQLRNMVRDARATIPADFRELDFATQVALAVNDLERLAIKAEDAGNFPAAGKLVMDRMSVIDRWLPALRDFNQLAQRMGYTSAEEAQEEYRKYRLQESSANEPDSTT